MTNYEDVEEVKPFRSFRKGKEVSVGEVTRNSGGKGEEEKKSSPVKLKYEYPVHDNFENKG